METTNTMPEINTAWVFNNRNIYETGSLDLLEIIGLVLFRGMLLTTKSKI